MTSEIPTRRCTPSLSQRPAQAADEELARTIHWDAYREVVTRQFGGWDETLQEGYFRKKWHPEKFAIVLADGIPCGYLAVEEHAHEIVVNEIALLGAFRGRGVGSALLSEILGRARGSQRAVRLQVLKENRARELYRRLGFVETGSTETHVTMEARPPAGR